MPDSRPKLHPPTHLAERISSATELYWCIDAEGRYTYLNAAWEKLLGYPLEEMVGRKFSDFQPEEEAEARLARLARFASEPQAVQSESVLRRKDGSLVRILFHSEPLVLEGRFAGYSGMGFDLTAYRKRESELELTRELFDLGFEGVFIHDGGQIVDCNRAIVEILGYASKDEIIGKQGPFEIVAPESRALVLERVQGGSTHPIEVWCIRKDGSRVLIETQSKEIRYLGRPMRMAAVRDITEKQKLIEAAQRSQKLESLGILAGGIAHDFNNLLGGIYGYVDYALSKSGDPQVDSPLARALATIDRARGLTQQLLTFAKGGAPIRKVGALFPFVEETVRFIVSGSSVGCRFEVEPGLPASRFDRSQIGQVVDNLAINAKQAMPTGGILDVRAGRVALRRDQVEGLPPGDYVRISFSDTGIGIPHDILPRIFDPFFTTKQTGSGLGLATCYSILKQHDGGIAVESEPGKGTTFTVYLPVSEETPEPEIPPDLKTARERGLVLILDDEEVIRDMIGEILADLKYAVKGFADGGSLLDYLDRLPENQAPAAILLDLTVPGGQGGRDVAPILRRKFPKTALIVSSGYADDPLMAEPEKYGIAASLGKPFRRSELLSVLAKVTAG